MSQVHRICFVTGRLAEQIVRYEVNKCSTKHNFDASVIALPITVAALMTAKWLKRHLRIDETFDRIILPGHLVDCEQELRKLLADDPHLAHFEIGPRDIRDLDEYLGGPRTPLDDYGDYSVEILAEINHAPRLSPIELAAEATSLRDDGADVIDLGCTPGNQWRGVGDAVKRLCGEGFRVSIDSFDAWEVAEACRAGAELVLSVNSSNREQAADWGCEVVVVPDEPQQMQSLHESVEFLQRKNVPLRIDPILEPIGLGFAASLDRYQRCRRDFPDAKMLMGIGNLTEMTDVDSAGVNALLIAICEELRIESVLTTQVINWARTSVRECDRARRLAHFACRHRRPAKHLDRDLVMLRDEKIKEHPPEYIQKLATTIKDNNFRIFASAAEIHAVSSGVHARDADPFIVMEQLLSALPEGSITTSHAFYLGFEMCKALTALTLGKNYEQDQALNWGMHTRPEDLHRLPRNRP